MKLEFEAPQAVRITSLSQPALSGEGQLLAVSGNEMRLALDLPVKIGDPIKLEWSRYLILGEVASVESPAGVIRVQVQHALFDTEKLANQRRLWL